MIPSSFAKRGDISNDSSSVTVTTSSTIFISSVAGIKTGAEPLDAVLARLAAGQDWAVGRFDGDRL
jgi:hypothetical protein